MAKVNSRDNELNRRLVVLGVSLLMGVVVVAVLSMLLASPDSQAGAFLLDRHTEGFMYPFTIQNVMWLMFFIGSGELWVRFSQSTVELAEVDKQYLPEDESSML